MRADDFWIDNPLEGFRTLNREMIEAVLTGSLEGVTDVDAAVALARLVHDEFESFGTGGNPHADERMDEDDSARALLALRQVLRRLRIEFAPPFRDFRTFRQFWIREGAANSYQARRDILNGLFDNIHERLVELELSTIASTLSNPISPRRTTGWPRIDEELAELRRHFGQARSEQDFRNVGNDCVIVLECLSAAVYSADRHLREGEAEPPVSNTKQRLERCIEVELEGAANSELRKLAKATIEFAQAVKHRGSGSRRDAGIAADSVIQLVNIMRRISPDLA
ncbi:hypothetical protein FHJ30_17450 [Arthrobacter sp. BB-1]|uniref:hypothetical protein n=1 Tax=unclassified Arthrobacter TaxID=235627 RepID=UPI0010EE6293|nr:MULTISPECIES: hypothetical protein [unclassified Arthrobacter]TNB69737.1 hypothetical protein FHJ30_17450 [Arthrobacter sp. BB-1]VII97893.1 hypothetical protein [Arthrobacter sp. DR-2P]